MPTSSATVSKGDPQGGCWFSAPASDFIEDGVVKADLISKIETYVKGTGDTDWSTLTSGFTYVSDVSDSGIVMSEESDTEEKKNMDGDTVLVVTTSRSETAKITPIDITVDSLKQIYGDTNVSADSTSGIIKVHHNGDAQVDQIGMFLLAYAYQGTSRRGVVLVPRYKVSERGDETLLNSELKGRELTIEAMTATVDGKKDTVFEVIAPIPTTTKSEG